MKLTYIQQAAPDKSAYLRIIIKKLSTKTYVVGTQKNRLTPKTHAQTADEQKNNYNFTLKKFLIWAFEYT